MFLSFLITGGILFALSARAICPVCVVAVGAGVGIAEEFGVDDTIIGLWIGALIIAMAWWTVNWFIQKNWCFKGCGSLTFLGYYLLISWPLYSGGLIGKELNVLWGIDKLLLGILLGSILFYLSSASYFYLKERNGGRAYFPFQKVAMPLGALAITSAIFYFLTN